MNNSPLYKDSGKIALASKLSVQVRAKMFAKFMNILKPDAKHRVLDIGVTSDDKFQESNYFERLYPYKDKIVCVGTENGSYLEDKYPGIKFLQIKPGERLPFEDHEFDIAFSNAVIEHVGSRDSQRAFIMEMLRVSRSFFLTTPNRWFPIEFHTALPLIHYLPPNIYRRVLAGLGEPFWSREENLNLLSKKELDGLFPKQVSIVVENVKVFGITTNLVAIGKNANFVRK
jgi:hypothetical protein